MQNTSQDHIVRSQICMVHLESTSQDFLHAGSHARWLACTLVAMEAGFKHLLQPPMVRDLGERARRNLHHSSEIWPCTREPSVAFLQKTTRPSHPFRPSDPPVRPTRKCDGRTDRKFSVGITSRNAVGEKSVFEYKIRNMIALWD